MEQRRINPYKLFLGSFIPNWLLCRSEISQGAKLCWARLAQFAGEDGLCCPKQETLASEIGVSPKMTGNYLRELKEKGLIDWERKGMGKCNHYIFLAHPWMKSWASGSEPSWNNASDQVGTMVPPRVEESFRSTNGKENHLRESDKERLPAGADASPLLPFSEDEAELSPAAFGRRVVTVWNATTPKRFVKVRDVLGRAKLVEPRLRDKFWKANWEEALKTACKTPALAKGGGWNKKNWKPNFAWFCRTDTVSRLIEGDYGKEPRKRKTGHKENRSPDGKGGFIARQVEDDGAGIPEDMKKTIDTFFADRGIDRESESA